MAHNVRMPDPQPQRLALGLSYRGSGYRGWQSQPDGHTVQDRVEAALGEFAAAAVATVQTQVRHRVLRAFGRRSPFDPSAGEEMGGWAHGGGFSIDQRQAW